MNPTGPWWRSFNRNHWFVFTVASLAWLFDCLDQQVFNLSRDGAVEDLFHDRAKALEFAPYTTSVFLVGWAIGGLIFGSLGDRFGRARMLAITMLGALPVRLGARSDDAPYWPAGNNEPSRK